MADTWSYSVGEYGETVRVYERKPGGNIYIATQDPDGDGELRRSLGHKDRDRAKQKAEDELQKLREGQDTLTAERPTVRRVFRLYRKHRTPEKSQRVQKADARQLEMWKRVLGADFDLSKLSRREWDTFIRKRRSGEIDARGRSEGHPDFVDGDGVGDRTIERDLRFLRAVVRWAMSWRDSDGRLLMERDPTRGLEIPEEKNPNRPVATDGRVDAIRSVYHDVEMRVERGGRREHVESYLPEIFEIVVGTGRRISPVCSLRMKDLDLEESERAPHGAIVWPADTDKEGQEWRCPISGPVRKALQSAIQKRRKVLGRVGSGPLFPSPGNPEQPVRYEEASAWLRAAERKADVESQDGSLWHAYRRLWATARKNMPDVDVAKAGGWSSVEAMRASYQHPTSERTLQVVQGGAEVREA